jgi:hypothetical protein
MPIDTRQAPIREICSRLVLSSIYVAREAHRACRAAPGPQSPQLPVGQAGDGDHTVAGPSWPPASDLPFSPP